MNKRRLNVFFSSRSQITFWTHALAAFGVLSAIVQVPSAVWGSDGLLAPLWITLSMVMLSLSYGLWRVRQPRSITREFRTPGMTIEVATGDLFERREHLVVGFTDTFDTDTSDNRVINSSSVQGQLLSRVYERDRLQLDADIVAALREEGLTPESVASRKTAGKQERYPIGTTLVLNGREQKIFAVAYSRMGDNLVAKSSIHDLWSSLGDLWEQVYERAQREAIAMPIVGSELARINCLDRESLLKTALLSFVARSREELISRRLVLVIRPHDAEQIDMLEVKAFLDSL